jgi:hypothetical protein
MDESSASEPSVFKTRVLRAGNRYAGETGMGRTLGQMIERKMALVAVCPRCKHRRVLFSRNFIERFGADCPAIELRRHMRCTQCCARAPNLHESAR